MKPSAIGDVILTIPSVEAFKKSAGGEIWWVCGETSAPILSRYKFVDRIILLNERKLFRGTPLQRAAELLRIWRSLIGVRFETYAVLQYDIRYRLIGLPVRAANTLFLKRGDRASEAIRGRSTTDEFARLLMRSDGDIACRTRPIPMPGIALRGRNPKLVGLVPGGAKNLVNDSPLRRWPLDYYVDLAKLLIQEGYRVSLVGADSDRWTLPAFENIPITENLGALSITQSVELIADMEVVVTHDTGLLHMAGLTETPIVAIFGPTTPREVLPNRKDIACLWGGENLACRPCYDGQTLPKECLTHSCMRAITPPMAFQAILEITRRSRGNQQATHGDLSSEIISIAAARA